MSKWLDKFLQEQKITKLARNIEASYVEHLSRLIEGKSNKFSSIEDALKDFSERLGLSNSEMLSLKKKAMKKIAEQNKIFKIAQIKQKLETLKEEGITDPKAVSFMAKSKGKHQKDTASPFSLNEKEGDQIVEILNQKKKEYDSRSQEVQNSEFSSSLTAHVRNRLQKVAEEFGKVLPFEKPSLESLDLLKKELSPLDTTDAFKAARIAYKFSSLSGGSPKAGAPVKVQTFEYAPLAPEVIKLMNENLRDQISKEMNFDEWISFLKESTQEVPEGSQIIDKLEKMKNQLVGEDKYNLPEDKPRVRREISYLLERLPQSFQKIVLRLISRGEYRRFLTRREDAEHSKLYSSSYQRSSFLLMDSFGILQTVIPKFSSKESKIELAKKIVSLKKKTFSAEEFKELLQSTGNNYIEKETKEDTSKQVIEWGPASNQKLAVEISNVQNPNYKPLIPNKTSTGFEDQHNQMVGFHNKIADAISEGLPLAYEPQEDGSVKPLSIHDLSSKREDYTQPKIGSESKIDNKNLGLHPSFSAQKLPSLQQNKSQKGTGSSILDQILNKKKEQKSNESSDLGTDSLLQDLLNKKSNVISKALQKLAEVGSWVSDKGQAFSTEEQMKESFRSEWLKKFEDQIVEILANNLQKQLKSGQASPQPVKKELEDESEEQKLPLAAHIKTKLRQLKANKHTAIKNRIEKLIK
jgi:hypothetical protein